MMEVVDIYRCAHCEHFYSENEDEVLKHEQSCIHNPDVHLCNDCEFFIECMPVWRDPDDFPCRICTKLKLMWWSVDEDRINCEEFSRKSRENRVVGQLVMAPWSERMVELLNKAQASRGLHPYTCSGGGGPHSGVNLIATREGWFCPACGHVVQFDVYCSLINLLAVKKASGKSENRLVGLRHFDWVVDF